MLKIEKKDHNALTERYEIIAIANEPVTPSMTFIQENLAKELKKEKELVVVKRIDQKFGMDESKIIAYTYDSQEALIKFEPKKKEKNKAEKTEEKKE